MAVAAWSTADERSGSVGSPLGGGVINIPAVTSAGVPAMVPLPCLSTSALPTTVAWLSERGPEIHNTPLPRAPGWMCT